ncbi:MAG TPA: hypothetical protein VLM05_05115 [Mycobacteriales bacterium]|nr:hypothetical protein [Mycobacteriales bacterium]
MSSNVDRRHGPREIVPEALVHCAVQSGRTNLAAHILRGRPARREPDRRRLHARSAGTPS